MRSKAPLVLMEQAVMVLVFALAAALCVRVFAWCDRTSERLSDRSRAVIRAENAAEILKNEGSGGKTVESVLDSVAEKLGASDAAEGQEPCVLILYDKDWNVAGERESAAYGLWAEPADSGEAGLAVAHIRVKKLGDAEALFELDVAWQTEVTA